MLSCLHTGNAWNKGRLFSVMLLLNMIRYQLIDEFCIAYVSITLVCILLYVVCLKYLLNKNNKMPFFAHSIIIQRRTPLKVRVNRNDSESANIQPAAVLGSESDTANVLMYECTYRILPTR